MKLEYDDPLSKVALKFKLRRYTTAEFMAPHTPTVKNPAGHALRFAGAGRAAGLATASATDVCVSLLFRTSSTAAVGGMPLASAAGLALKWTRVGGLTATAGRGLHSFRFQLNLSSSVHRVTQLNS